MQRFRYSEMEPVWWMVQLSVQLRVAEEVCLLHLAVNVLRHLHRHHLDHQYHQQDRHLLVDAVEVEVHRLHRLEVGDQLHLHHLPCH